jgi:hypothetical protein
MKNHDTVEASAEKIKENLKQYYSCKCYRYGFIIEKFYGPIIQIPMGIFV